MDAAVADDEAGLVVPVVLIGDDEAAVVGLIRLLSFFRFGILLFCLFQRLDLTRLLQLHRCLCEDCLLSL